MTLGDMSGLDSSADLAPLCGAAGMGARLQLVVAGRVVAQAEASNVEVEENPAGGFTWDVRGDGTLSILILKADNGGMGGAHWIHTEASVLGEFSSGQWHAGTHDVPEHHSVLALQDGRPAFVDDLSCVQLVALPMAVEDHVCIRGLKAWNGQAFADNLAEFRAIYQQWLTEVQAKVPTLRRDPKACPHDELRTAMAVYAYRRILGGAETDALASADAIMRGLDPKLCRDPAADSQYPTPGWLEIRSDLRSGTYPALGGAVNTHSSGSAPPSSK